MRFAQRELAEKEINGGGDRVDGGVAVVQRQGALGVRARVAEDCLGRRVEIEDAVGMPGGDTRVDAGVLSYNFV